MKSFKIGDLTIKLPIIQGGMGVGISLSGLASAVANEGGVGVISCAGMGLLYPKFSKDYLTNSIMGLKEEIRKARGIKQEDLALELGVSRQTISSLEKGRYNPSILLAFKIARRFGLQIEDVFIYQEEDHE